ncbi:MAG: hypothetical protein CVV12_05740 [Gammaproteobacteria bacterium HGW-Gammaproteobacteria-2]|nr:MAG: hypothetical protein CVV12_05740 [Gammaproteobacteria bacterium HGW-Gammaproteobacteria-2]
MDPIMLARLQFAANMSFHILFPSITLALAWLLLFFKLRHRRSGDPAWAAAYRTWVKVFALTFALGVVSGITMSFQFGTNWPGFMLTVGNIAEPLLGYEVLTAFFLEASFLGIMLFGQQRVSPCIHTLATALVAIGTTLSAFWILALNSWMQTPQGFEMKARASWLRVTSTHASCKVTPLASHTRTATLMPARTLWVTTQKFSNWARMRSRFWYCAAGSARCSTTSARGMRQRPSASRSVWAVAVVRSAPGWFLNLRSANNRLADRQLATAASSSREGFGPLSSPSGGGSSVIRSSTALPSKRMRNS